MSKDLAVQPPDKLPCRIILPSASSEGALVLGAGVPVSALHRALCSRADFVAQQEARTPEQIAQDEQHQREFIAMLGPRASLRERIARTVRKHFGCTHPVYAQQLIDDLLDQLPAGMGHDREKEDNG